MATDVLDCPGCTHPLDVPEEELRETVTCVSCGGMYLIVHHSNAPELAQKATIEAELRAPIRDV